MRLTSVAAPLLIPASQALRSSGNGILAEPEMAPKRVAIIGAGAAGSSTAYHLSHYAEDAGIPTNITVIERNDYIGGRTTTVNAWSDPTVPVELGGSIFVSVNHILVSAAKTFNLSTSALENKYTAQDIPELGIWNGREFVVVTRSEDGWWEKAKLLWRYGLAPIKTNSLMKSTVAKFLRMYEEPVFPWKSLSEVVETVGLLETTGVTGEQYLKANGIGEKFSKEIIQASTRVNYASNLGLIHGLETMVCMATNGAVAVEGGNWQIFAHMLASSPSTSVHLNATVTSLSKQPDNTYKITSSTGETSTFDSVVLAAPFQFSKLNVEPRPQRIPDRIPYVALHVTLFASPHELDPAAFNLKPEEKVPQFVLTVLPEGEDHGLDPNGQGSPGFFSISVVNRALSPEGLPENIYKIFSAERVTPSFLSRILGQDIQGDDSEGKSSIHTSPNGHISWIHQKLWHSYPYEYPRVTFENIKLDEGLWYTSGIESFISTMETSALMGKNVARLVVDDWMEKRRNEKVGESLRVQKGEGWRYEGAGKEDQKPIRAKL